MIHLEGHEFVRLLRREDGDRAVFETRYHGQRACTRLLLYPVERSRNAVVAALAMNGRGSSAGMPPAVRDTLEAYRIRHHLGDVAYLPKILDAGVAVDAPSAEVPLPPEGSGWAYVTTAWIEGVHLDDALRELRDGSARRELMGHVAKTLAALHEHLVSFGDLKPTNIVVGGLDRTTGSARVAFIDMDTLREVPGADACVQTTAATQEYAAPEQISRFETWLTSDVWAFGETLLRVVGGGLGVEALEPSWRAVVLACRQVEPLQRPSASQLAAHLLHGAALPTAQVSADSTRRVADDPFATRYVEDPAHGTGEDPDATAYREPRVATAQPVPRLAVSTFPIEAREVGTTRGLATVGILFGLAGAGLLALVFGLYGYYSYTQYTKACASLESLREELHQHKVDRSKNGSKTLNSIVERGDEAFATCASDSGRGMLALAKVWQQHWHMASAKSITPSDFNALRPEIDAVRALRTPEAVAAVVAFDSSGCRLLPDDTSERLTLCQNSHQLAQQAQTLVSGSEWGWLRVEIAWADAMAGLGMAQQIAEGEKHLDLAVPKAAEALARCDVPPTDLAQAPVNGLEMLETCMQLAGYAQDYQRYDAFVGQLVDMYRTEGKSPADTFEKVYQYTSPKCDGFTSGKDHAPYKKRARYGDGGWDDFCRVSGARALGCGDRFPRPTRENCTCCPMYGGGDCLNVMPRWGCYSLGSWNCSSATVLLEAPGVPWSSLDAALPAIPQCLF